MLEVYRDLFINREDVYARQQRDGQGYVCVREPVTDQVITAHLEGQITCGFYCLNEDNQVKWAVIDLDHEDGIQKARDLYLRLNDLAIPSYIEESRQGRAHLWIFTPSWPAKPMRLLMQALMNGERIEVFPKQEQLKPGSVGSLVRGPLGIHRKTGERYGFLDPETLERVEDHETYLSEVHKAEGQQLAHALNTLLTEKPAFPHERVIYNRRTHETLAVANLLGISLEQRKTYYQGICPFHPDEEHPSFTIYPNRNVWICWHDRRVGYGGASLFAAVTGISLEEARETLDERF